MPWYLYIDLDRGEREAKEERRLVVTTGGNISSLIATADAARIGHEHRAASPRRTTMAMMMLRAMQLVVQRCVLGAPCIVPSYFCTWRNLSTTPPGVSLCRKELELEGCWSRMGSITRKTRSKRALRLHSDAILRISQTSVGRVNCSVE